MMMMRMNQCLKLCFMSCLAEDTVTPNKRREKMMKALERIVTSSKFRQQKKFSRFLRAVRECGPEFVAKEVEKDFNAAGLHRLVTGEFTVSSEQCFSDLFKEIMSMVLYRTAWTHTVFNVAIALQVPLLP